MLSTELEHLRRQGYAIAGRHSAVKLCHWTRKKLEGKGICYKERFYGIECHRCMQMTPVLGRCNLQCQFCWRHMTWQEQGIPGVDDPAAIVDGCIKAQRRLLTGYGGNPRVNRDLLKEANHPNQCAISLTGEPTLYPYLGGLIRSLTERRMHTFLVTNGTFPEVLERLEDLPTQLYISVTAPDPETFERLCSPVGSRGWKEVMRSVEVLSGLGCRTVIRHTLVKGWNMHGVEEYASIDLRGSPMFIEAKGFSLVGESRGRMRGENMPSHHEVRIWAERLAELTGYIVYDEQVESRVVLLVRSDVKDRVKLPLVKSFKN